jgi:DNA-binding SARP family transcriptional activator
LDIEFRVLGSLEVRVDGKAMPLGTPKQRKLLALLVLHASHLVSWSCASLELWGDNPPESAPSNLRSYAAGLRALFLPEVPSRLLTRPAGYLLRADDSEVDLGRFSTLADEGNAALEAHDAYRAIRILGEALTLWRGEPAEDVPIGPVLSPIVAAIKERRISVAESYAAARLSIGETYPVIGDLRDLLARNPCRERGWALLMAAQYWAGDVAGALEAFVAARSAFRDHLGIEPGEQLQWLQRAILNHGLNLPQAAAFPVLTEMALPRQDQRGRLGAAIPQQLPAPRTILTGCADQLRLVTSALAGSARHGRARLAIVHGPPGSGKSALALTAAHQVAPRFPDGQLYLDLSAASASPLADADEVAGILLRALASRTLGGVPAAARLRSVLTGRRLLMFLDNVADPCLVRSLIPAEPRCAVLVTSSQSLGTLGAATRVVLDRYKLLEPPGDQLNRSMKRAQ